MRKNLLRGLFLIFTSSSIFTQSSYAQKSMINYIDPESFSIGMSVGMTDLWGDVGTQSIVNHYLNEAYWKNTKFIGGITIGYSFIPALKLRADINYGTLYATDKFNKEKATSAANIEDDAYQRYVRNQEVKTLIWEGDLMFEFTPLRLNFDGNAALKKMQPYILAGIGAYHFNAKGNHISRDGYSKGWMPLYDLNVEGNGWNFDGAPERYTKWQMSVPLGLGLKWDLDDRLTFGVEYLYRYCFTDYLDNVSGNYVSGEYFNAKYDTETAKTAHDLSDRSWEVLGDKTYYHKGGEVRGNKDVMDAFSSLNVRLTWKLKSKRIPWWY